MMPFISCNTCISAVLVLVMSILVTGRENWCSTTSSTVSSSSSSVMATSASYTPVETNRPPTVTRILKAKSTSLLISWIPYQAASEYYIRYHADYSDHDIEIEHVPPRTDRIKLDSLHPDTKYIIVIEVRLSESYSVCTLDITEFETLPGGASSGVDTALLIVCCVLAALIIILLILLCIVICCIKRRRRHRQIIIDDSNYTNGQVPNKGVELRNPGYRPDDGERPNRPLSQTSHAFIYMTPENSPTEKESPNVELSVDTQT